MDVNQFKGSFAEMARPNRYILSGGGLPGRAEVLAKATSLPPTSIGKIEVGHMGWRVPIPGDRVFDDWSMTFFQDSSNSLRNYFQAWKALIENSNAHAQYKRDFKVEQVFRNGETVVESYTLFGCVLTDFGQVELDWSSNDTAAEFSITVAYDYFER